jgi:hypothetical protein
LTIDIIQQVFQASGMSSGGTVATATLNLDTAVLADSVQVFLNGVLQLKSGSISGDAGDYNFSGTTLTMVDALDSDDVLTLRYIRN